LHRRRVNVGIEERVSSGRCGARASETASLPLLISLALDEVDATDVHLRFRGDVNPGRDEASVTGDSALGRPDARFVADGVTRRGAPGKGKQSCGRWQSESGDTFGR
jgi:hypothetical protein